ncbi:MAG: glucosaminidase domain-containing protein [Candidatus Levybacteria bacterium]|nr:glucosaminidase domain-containing protein [Candidatus Levybacteria bacterium]
MKKLLLLTFFFTFTPVLIFVSILYALFLSYNYRLHNGLFAQNTNHKIAFAALPSAENVLGDEIIFKDARIEIVRQFFQKYKSPLEPFASNVIEAADKYSLDFRLLPAIAMQESNLCRKIIKNSYNCWGFGIYGKKITRFESYAEAIDTVTKTLVKNYKTLGLETPEEIMGKYTPSNNGSWANSVNYFMSMLQ